MEIEDIMSVPARQIPQQMLTGECWMIQLDGPWICKTCVALGTDDCTGQAIRKTGKNSKGHSVPLGQT